MQRNAMTHILKRSNKITVGWLSKVPRFTFIAQHKMEIDTILTPEELPALAKRDLRETAY